MPQLNALKTIKENTFIFEQQNALAAELCDDMIQRFEANKDD